jgi:hypothetical protein
MQLVLLLQAWAERTGQNAQIARNLAVRWIEAAPKVGIDPDVSVLCPPPPEGGRVESLRLWVPGHHVPLLCFEIVSKNHPHKDYAEVHLRYAAMGAREVVVFDPLLAGPKALGGPVSLQIWRCDAAGALACVYFGPGPARSEILDAWLIVQGQELAIASEPFGEHWQTNLERERAEKELERAEKERALAEMEHALAEIERARAETERERAEKERERAARVELERRLAELERQRG